MVHPEHRAHARATPSTGATRNPRSSAPSSWRSTRARPIPGESSAPRRAAAPQGAAGGEVTG
eukprot:5855360-Pyramimonas_sp.AAC.1